MSRRTLVCWLAVFVLVAAACTRQEVSVETTSTTAAAAVSNTTPTVAETGAQGLAWSKVFEVPGSYHVESIVAAHGRFYVLANDFDAGYYSPSVMWTSEDGTDWVEIEAG